MKHLLTALLLSTGLVSAEQLLSSASVADAKPLVEGQSEFAVKLLPLLGEGNLFYSPYSISSALSMTWAGAKGETADEMVKALMLPGAGSNEQFLLLKQDLEAASKETEQILGIANGLAMLQGQPREAYRESITNFYDAEIFPGDLARINGWVKDKTQGRIDPMLDQLPGGTAAVILNAIYFKGSWDKAFDPKRTREAPFHVAVDQKLQVPMMYQKERVQMVQNEELQFLRLPYGGDRFAMNILLPKEKHGLAAVEKELTAEKMADLFKQLNESRKQESIIFLPRFKMEGSYKLVEPMKELGMKAAFSPSAADFSGIMGSPGELYVGDILHKSFVEVNEEGTEAAAATAVVMRATSVSMGPPPPLFRADHPFLFFITEKESGAILFMGRLAQPQE